MGAVMRKTQVDPKISRLQGSSLLKSDQEISRANFKFLRKVATSGIDQESVLWLASNSLNSKELFYVRQISKIKVYNHKRVQAVLDQMTLLTQISSPYIIKIYFAFHDYQFLYLVMEPIQSIPFTLLLHNYPFTEDHTRYVVSALISVLEELHAKGYAFTELSPSNIHFDRQTGHLKVLPKQLRYPFHETGKRSTIQLMEIPNPALIDSYYSSNAVTELCRYSAPQILLRGKVLAESDFYSIGVIIYEMMTQEPAFSQEKLVTLDRMSILKQQIEVEKSKIPVDWESESADFLIKLLIKNPALRLGRFGTFELKNHGWLRSFDQLNQFRKLEFTGFESKQSEVTREPDSKPLEDDYAQQLIKNHYFQALFEEYSFRRQSSELQQYESTLSKSQMLFNQSSIKLHMSNS